MMTTEPLFSILRQSGWLSRDQESHLIELMTHQQLTAMAALQHMQLFTATELVQHLSETLNLRLITPKDEPVLTLIETLELADLTLSYHALPIAIHHANTLTLAVSDPTQTELIPIYQFATGFNIDIVLTDWLTVQRIIKTLQLRQKDHHAANQLSEALATYEDTETDHTRLSLNDAPVSQYIHQVLSNAFDLRASDVHFEPYEHHYRIRMRIDGVLLTQYTPAKHLSQRFISRIKILANLNIAEKRRPQDGRFKLQMNTQQTIDFRVSTLATQWGEKIVLRLLNTHHQTLGIDALGLPADAKDRYQSALSSKQGMILVTGPTGSGKTQTLYSGLHHLNSEQVNISTIEDPIEIQLDGINQIQINPAVELGFNPILRTLLRQDPDIIMVGEIRDTETANTAFRAAQTGHLVLSTLHTNSALDTLIRLRQMGMAAYVIASSIQLIIAQRLVRQLCPRCKRPATKLPHASLANSPPLWEANPQGCPDCIHGYHGRLGVFEILPMNEPLQRAIHRDAHRDELAKQAFHTGFRPLMESGLDLVKQGQTSYDELIRVLGIPNESEDTL